MNRELQHHGIKGQRWGVRRYQNYDGSYTKRGMKRYTEKLSSFEKADTRYQIAKKNKDNKTELTQARLNRRVVKRQLDKSYKHLKQDKAADKGKELYSKGKTIKSERKKAMALTLVNQVSNRVANKYIKEHTDTQVKALQYIAVNNITTTTVQALIAANYYKNRKNLRAYYNHTSK